MVFIRQNKTQNFDFLQTAVRINYVRISNLFLNTFLPKSDLQFYMYILIFFMSLSKSDLSDKHMKFSTG